MRHSDLPEGKLHIAGEWREGRGTEIVSRVPADGSLNRMLRGASVEDVDLAIERTEAATRDPARRIGRAIEAGAVRVNTRNQFSIATPFGGVKDSGLGREKGREGIRAWMAQQSIYDDLGGQPRPWAAPALAPSAEAQRRTASC